MLHSGDMPLTETAAALAAVPCDRPCSVCDGQHHWLDECADEGDPIQVCKHCPAWRPYPDSDS